MKKEIKYRNKDITVVWKPDLCQGSGKCYGGLPQVFKPRERPWVQMDEATTTEIIEQVNICPSGALSFYYND